MLTYQNTVQQGTHYALVKGRLDGSVTPLVRVHVTDTLRDLIGVRSDATVWALHDAVERIAHSDSGVVVVLKEQESTSGRESEGAVLRTYGVGAQILKDLGVRRMRVLSAPKQMLGISAFDLEIEGYVGEDVNEV